MAFSIRNFSQILSFFIYLFIRNNLICFVFKLFILNIKNKIKGNEKRANEFCFILKKFNKNCKFFSKIC